MVLSESLNVVGVTREELNQNIIATMSSGECTADYRWLGYCYPSRNWGQTWKLANVSYVYFAIHRLLPGNFKALGSWQKLETITRLLLMSSVTKVVNNKKHVLTIPQVQSTIYQQYIGECPHISENTVTLLVLAEGHNVIDSIFAMVGSILCRLP